MSQSIIATAHSISLHVTLYVGTPVFILGVLGGCLNIIVFLSLKTFRQSSCAFYLTIMAMVSVGYLVTGLLTFIMIYGSNIDWTKQSKFYCIFREGFVHICMLMAFTCLCLATIDQFLATCSSPRYQQLCNIKLARRLCLAFTLLWLLYGISFFTSYDLVTLPANGGVDCIIVNDTFQQYFKTWHVLVLLGVLPISITALFGCLAFRNVQKLSYRTMPLVRRELDKQLTVMVLMQVIFNVFAITPYTIINAIILNPAMTNDPVTNELLTCARILSIILLYTCFAVSNELLTKYFVYYYSLFRVHSTFIFVCQSDFVTS